MGLQMRFSLRGLFAFVFFSASCFAILQYVYRVGQRYEVSKTIEAWIASVANKPNGAELTTWMGTSIYGRTSEFTISTSELQPFVRNDGTMGERCGPSYNCNTYVEESLENCGVSANKLQELYRRSRIIDPERNSGGGLPFPWGIGPPI